MIEKQIKYANFLLEKCLCINPCEPLLIMYNTNQKDFVKILKDVSNKIGINEIYELCEDEEKTKDILVNCSIEEIKKHPYFDRSIIKKVYDKKGSILLLSSYEPSLLKNIKEDKINAMNKVKIETQKDAIKARETYKFPWCIAAVATKPWADELFLNEDDNVEKLWDLIFEITLINKDDPIKAWNEKVKLNNKKKDLLNKLKLKKLKYKNNLGTNLEIGLLDNCIWQGALKKDFYNKKDLIVNIPTEEVFTTPNKNEVNGIVVSSRPIQIRGEVINKFELTFKNGIVIDVKASNGKDKILELLNEFDGMKSLGECALVDYDSPISNTNLMFKNILIDENASCHLALGQGFSSSILNGENKTQEELLKKGINQSKNHIDFMIGTRDLSIIGTDIYDNEIPIFIDGNFAYKNINEFILKRKEK